MTRVFGGCVEPGGMELERDASEVPCPECGKPAVWRTWEAAEGGSINFYESTYCKHCGYADRDGSDEDDY